MSARDHIINSALRTAKTVSKTPPVDPRKVYTGPIHAAVPGRTDRLNVHVPSGSYVYPADVVSAMGEHNTLAGFKVIEDQHGKAKEWPELQRLGYHKTTPAVVAGGEYILDPEQVRKVGKGDIEQGQNDLDKAVLAIRKKSIKTLKGLPGPAKD